jgi:hypothetical protein
MTNRDIVVTGASAGRVEAIMLMEAAGDLPPAEPTR